ncbi:divalent-cation tolerance protein CutA [bacterium]|jgi:periplasmic divalent cation tolerance protein|nr:divalent-cation tolerance protein CutA [bacterium]
MSADEIYMAFITAPDVTSAKKIAKGLVLNKLAACVNIIPSINSFFMWKGGIQEQKEALLIAKTARAKLQKAKKWILKHHPYDLPEILYIKIDKGHEEYMRWVKELI